MDWIRPQSELLTGDEFGTPEDSGVAIESAYFTGTAKENNAAELFDLTVVDDRTLAIVPKYATMMMALEKASSVKGSYKTGIEVFFSDGSSQTVKDAKGNDAVLTITVKKSLPKLKVGKLTFNSVVAKYSNEGFEPDYISLGIKGGTVTALEADEAAAAKAKKTALPDWIRLNQDYGGNWYAGLENNNASVPNKGSGKLYLLATVEGWAIKPSIVVNYTINYTTPKVTFKPASITLNTAIGESAYTLAAISPSRFGEYGRFDFEITKVTEGSGKKLQMYTKESTPAISDILSLSIGYPYGDNGPEGPYMGQDGKAYCFVNVGPAADTTTAHTYKVYCTFCGKDYTFTVKTNPQEVKLSVKQSGSILVYSNAGFADKSIKLTPTLKNYNSAYNDDYYYSTGVTRVAKGSTEEEIVISREYGWNGSEWENDDGEDCVFKIWRPYPFDNTNKNIEVYPANEWIEPGYTYYLYTMATYFVGFDEDGNAVHKQTEPVRTKLNIKWTNLKNQVTWSTSVSGSIDVLRPYSTRIQTVAKNSLGGFAQYIYMIDNGYDGDYMPILVRETYEGKKLVEKKEISLGEEAFEDGMPNPFEVGSYPNARNQPVNTLMLKDGFADQYDLLNTYKFKLKTYKSWNSKKGEPNYQTIALNIKKGSVKIKATPATLTLYVNDRYSQADFDITSADQNLTDIYRVEISGSSTPFKVVNRVGSTEDYTPSSFATLGIGFRTDENGAIAAGLKAGQTKTVKLNVWHYGNKTNTPDATVSVKVLLK